MPIRFVILVNYNQHYWSLINAHEAMRKSTLYTVYKYIMYTLSSYILFK